MPHKIILTTLSLILIGYVFSATFLMTRKKYDYATLSPFCGFYTDALQPIMHLFFYQKVTHHCHWLKIEYQDNFQEIGLVVRSLETTRSLKSNLSLNDRVGIVLAEMNGQKESAIIKPKNYKGDWSMGFCNSQNNFCQRSKLEHAGSVKILVDGEGIIWGFDDQNQEIELEIVKTGQVKNLKADLYI